MDTFTILFGGGFTLGGLIFLTAYVVQQIKANAAKAWPTVPGTVLSAGLNAQTSFRSSGSSSTTYAPNVIYDYSLMGQKYTGNQLAFGNVYYDYPTAARKVVKYSPGMVVAVYYDPDNPANAVLETRSFAAGILLLMGIVFLLVGILSFIFLPVLEKYTS